MFTGACRSLSVVHLGNDCSRILIITVKLTCQVACYNTLDLSRIMLKLQPDSNANAAVELEIVKALQNEEYSFNTVNCHGENLLHLSVASGCLEVTREILRHQNARQVVDRKNKFGWTPLMLAVRSRDINMTKLLLENNANTNEWTYLGMSVLGLAAAINKDMFEVIFEACPSALLNTMEDDITPLCIAAMKNDKELFFRLIDLGFDISKANKYTLLMMKQSTIQEIVNLVDIHLDFEDYWNDASKNFCDSAVLDENTNLSIIPNIIPMFIFETADSKQNVDHLSKKERQINLNLLNDSTQPIQSLISPTLSCTISEMFPETPDVSSVKRNFDTTDVIPKSEVAEDQNEIRTSQRLRAIRPPDLTIEDTHDDLNNTLGYTPQFSPVRSPHVPADINDEHVFGESTPTPPRYRTPPKGMILHSEEAKMVDLLKRYKLSQYAPLFLEQEIDVDLFMTLTENDLIEIGVNNMLDRKSLLFVITEYTALMCPL